MRKACHTQQDVSGWPLGNHGNHGKVMELFLVMEKVMEFQKSSKSWNFFYKDYSFFLQ